MSKTSTTWLLSSNFDQSGSDGKTKMSFKSQVRVLFTGAIERFT